MSINNEGENYSSTGCITIGRMAPNFTTLSTEGFITLSQYRGKWVIILSEPGNFAATSTASLLAVSMNFDEFLKRDVQVLALTIDNNFSNIEWLIDIYRTYGVTVPFPLLEDRNADIARMYGIVNPDRIYENSVRDVFIISPEGRINAILTYPVSCGRNIFEILRIIDSLKLTEAYNVYTPTNWVPGDSVMIPTTHRFSEALQRSKGDFGMGLDCRTWYGCFVDYYSLINSNEGNSGINE